MFDKEDYFLIGTLSKTHGVSGEILIKSGNLNDEDIYKMESVFIEFDGLLVPFFIEHISPKGPASFAFKFDGIDTEDQAAEFINCKVYSTDMLTEETDSFLASANTLIGFQVIDKNMGDLGVITEFLALSNNPLFKIKKGRREILLPANEEFLLEIDESKKTVIVQTPEGLVDLYTTS